MNHYSTMTQLATMLDSNRDLVGKRLAEIDLWTPPRTPTARAVQGGFCNVLSRDLVLWQRQKTLSALLSAGYAETIRPAWGRAVERGIIMCGDCLEQLTTLPDNSFDGGLCDGPYGLTSIVKRFGKPGSRPPRWDGSDERYYGRLAKGFMGHIWDSHVPSVEVWREVLRVLRPGAYLLVFGGTRTFHRLVSNIEDAGLIIRDTLCWLYGCGFPKSHNIGRASGSERWDGYGTALKPAFELIVLAQKPLDGTYAQNAMKWGCGGLNIAGCRIGDDTITTRYAPSGSFAGGPRDNFRADRRSATHKGRWPANLILNDEAAQLLDQQSGQRTSGKETGERGTGGIWSKSSGKPCGPQYGDTGGASRFFYCAKASKKERGEGNTHPTVKPLALCRYLAALILPPPRQTPRRILVPFSGSGSEVIGALQVGWEEAVGIEREEGYVRIADRRIAAAIPSIPT